MNKVFISFALLLACATAETVIMVSPATLSATDYADALAYGYVYGDYCTQCYPGCFSWTKFNNKCDDVCNNAACNWDNNHCVPGPEASWCFKHAWDSSKNCPWSEIGNGKCNWHCFNGECAWDGGDCFNDDCSYFTYDKKTNCNPACKWSMIGNSYCDPCCLTIGCYLDFNDCCPFGGCGY